MLDPRLLRSFAAIVDTGSFTLAAERSAVAGYGVRQYEPFGIEPPMAVSIYAWESAGPASELVERMGAVLEERHAPLAASG